MEEDYLELSLKEAIAVDMANNAEFSPPQKELLATAIINLYQATGIDVDKPGKDFSDEEKHLISSLLPAIDHMIEKIMRGDRNV